MVQISYDRQTINSPNPLARFAHRARIARALALADKALPSNGAILDFGAGPGTFLSALGERRPDITLSAFEPYMPPSVDARIGYLPTFPPQNTRVDVVTALEVCEHLSDADTEKFLAGARASLKERGILIVSVPIMLGAALPMKEINRVLLFRRASDYSASELLTALMGGTITRPENRLLTHKGFDFRWLRQLIQRHFRIESETCAPLPLPWWANSQIFFLCRPLDAPSS